jgi:hypothetical protein
VLVEGWGFTATAHQIADRRNIWVGSVPYWRPDDLAANDAAFATPSTATLAVLRDRYGVRWLFVDQTQGHVSPDLGNYADLTYRSGDCAIYELRGGDV